MSRKEKYPWSQLECVGDHFVVMEWEKPFRYISMMISQRNYKNRLEGIPAQFAVFKMSNATMVMLASVEGKRFDVDDDYTEFSSGVYMRVGGGLPINEDATTQRAKIARMTPEERVANLPWWHDPATNQQVLNTNLMLPQDLEIYVGAGQPIPPVETPYPARYHLDDNLRRTHDNEFSIDDLMERYEEDFGEPPIYEEGIIND